MNASGVIGLGMDLVECQRIRESVAKFGDRFMQRIFTQGEIRYAESQRDAIPSLAARFAAKEAVSKAFGTGIGEQLNLTDIEVCRHERGEPFIKLHGKGKQLLKERGGTKVLITLTHTKEYAAATALIVL
ncbi:MAG: holo-ACP synthase [Verrucomicrobiota bacterium]